MGYSIATPIRDEASKRKLMAFFAKEFRHWPELRGRKREASRYYRGPIPDDAPKAESLSYDHGPCRIGFDKNTSGFEDTYILTICRWMALQAGRIDTYPTEVRPTLQGSFPCIVYDGDEATSPDDGEGPWPIILDHGNIVLDGEDADVPGGYRLAKEHAWCLVSPCGLQTRPNASRLKEWAFYKELDGIDGRALIQAEMERLNTAWVVFSV